MAISHPISLYKESLWFLEPEQTLPAYVLESVGITYPDASYRICRPNGVDFYTIEYIVSGDGRLIFQDQTLFPASGDIYILPPGVPVEYTSNAKSPWEKIWINIGGELPESLIFSYQLQGQILFPHCPLKTEFEKLLAIVQHPGENVNLDFALVFHRMIAGIAARQAHRHNVRENDSVLKMKQFCEKNWRGGFRLEQLAALINRSSVQTLRIFRNAFGMPPGEWLQKKRLKFAQQYLLNTNCTLRNLTDLLGFKDEFYFANWFKKHAGIAPGQFRKHARKEKRPEARYTS